MEIHIAHAALTELAVDAVVLPCHSLGMLTDDMQSTLQDHGREGFEKELRAKAPLAIGAAILTEGRGLRASSAILVPISKDSGDSIATELLRRAVKAALIAAKLKGFRTLAIPSLIARDGLITVAEAARAVTQELHGHDSPMPETVYMIAPNEQLQRIFEDAVEHAQRAARSL